MHGELPGAASAFLSAASRVEVAAFFRYLREDVSQVDDDDLQAVFQLAFRHLPVLAHRALGRAMSAKPEPMGSLPTDRGSYCNWKIESKRSAATQQSIAAVWPRSIVHNRVGEAIGRFSSIDLVLDCMVRDIPRTRA
eukprot:COSAG05_NODE_30_length_28869_cov_54.944421_8_plen_137_part_00